MRRIYIVLVALTAGAACGSSPSSPGDLEATITIGATGIAPKEVRINPWGTVRFVNADTRPHTIVSDPPAHRRVRHSIASACCSRERAARPARSTCRARVAFTITKVRWMRSEGGSWFGSG